VAQVPSTGPERHEANDSPRRVAVAVFDVQRTIPANDKLA
jgi:hypothetical protein